MSFATNFPRWAPALALFCVFFVTAPAQAQWINEFHYDNASSDEGEAVEVVLPSDADPAD